MTSDGAVMDARPADELLKSTTTTKTTTATTTKKKDDVKFVVTGFGPFQNVKENPTTIIVNKLLQYLKDREKEEEKIMEKNNALTTPTVHSGGTNDDNSNNKNDNTTTQQPPPPPPLLSTLVIDSRVIETSADAAKSEINQIYDSFITTTKKKKECSKTENGNSSNNNNNNNSSVGGKDGAIGTTTKDAATTTTTTTVVVLLHLGLNYRGTTFQLERCAYNDANFRIPDERGYQPRNETIIVSQQQQDGDGGVDRELHVPLGATLETLLNIPDLVRRMNSTTTTTTSSKTTTTTTTPVPPSIESTDPGRFVCNYVYCYSLSKFKCCLCRSSSHNNNNKNSCNNNTTTTTTTTTTGSNNKNEQQPQQQQIGHSTKTATTTFRSLFLHVPPFDVVCEEDQLEFVARLLENIREQVLLDT